MRKILVLAALAFAATVLSVAVWAGVGVSPMLTELIMPPGSSHEDVIRVTNSGDEAILVKASMVSFIAPEGVPEFLDPEMGHYPYCGHDLVTIEPLEQTIQSGETFGFQYRVSMPEELNPYGGRYAAALFTVIPATTAAQVKVAAQVASLFLISPGGEAAPDLSFELLGIRQSETNSREVIITGRGENVGNLHISSGQVFGIVHVVDQDGYIVGEFEAFAHTMLPGEANAHMHEETWTAPDTLPSGEYIFHVTIVTFRGLGREHGHIDVEQVVELAF